MTVETSLCIDNCKKCSVMEELIERDKILLSEDIGDEGHITEIIMHSFNNILNQLVINIQLIKINSGCPDCFQNLELFCSQLVNNINDKSFITNQLSTISIRDLFQKDKIELISKLAKKGELSKINYLKKYFDLFKMIIDIFELNKSNIYNIFRDPKKVERVGVEWIKEKIIMIFKTIALNSKGRYDIVFSENEHLENPEAYYIKMDFDCLPNDTGEQFLVMPLIFVDIFRDLLANSRKYSDKGTSICGIIRQTESMIYITVVDEGFGIPESEIKLIGKVGFRGSNVKHIGGIGNGVSKALYFTNLMGGEMFVKSKENVGTIIDICVPLDHNEVDRLLNNK